MDAEGNILNTQITRQVYNGPQTSNLSQQQQKYFWSKMIFQQKIKKNSEIIFF